MVVSNQHTHRSSASAPGQPSKPRRKSSLNKQTERESPISINTSQNYSNTTNSRHHHHHHQHPRTLSSGSPHPSHERSRQSSAHIIHSNNNSNSTLAPSPQPVPRLSIADRFMYSNPAGASTATLSTPSATTPITTMSNSVQPEPAPMGGNGRLSVADRFMNSSPSTPAPINTSNYQKERSLSTFSGKTLASRNPSLLPTPSTDAQIERLTIASAFMKSTAESALSSPATYGRSREASVGDSDMGVGNKSTYSKTLYSNTDQLHPLQAPTDQQAALFDSDYLNLDLSLSSSAASSVINGGRNIRPWGSQDTLVQTDKKRPIYAQFIENEKNAMISTGLSNHDYPDTYSRPLSLSDYYDDKQDTTITMSDDMSTKHDEEEGYEYCDDTKEGYEKYDPKYEKYHHSEPYPGEKYMDDEKNPKRKFEHQDSLRNDYTNQGFWLGCCFISCGHRHEKKQDGKQGRQNRKEKDTELDARPKNRGCGRRGWVFCTFITLILSILITYFIWPRTPLMRIEGASLTTPAKITQTRQGVMVGNVAFESQWLVNVTVDNRQNHVPTRIVQVQLLAKDALTGLVIGKGLHNDDPNQEHIVLAANSISTIQLPVYVDYQARDATDTTFVDLTKACAPENSVVYNSPDGGVAKNQHEALPLHFWITLHFFGLDWLGYKPTVIATPATGGFACPQS